MSTYKPKPIDISSTELTEELNELREAIAENAHDIWAESRIAEGWTFGPNRNDEKKETPCLVPYSQLPEGEKEYDREMAIKTIKLLKVLGYDIIKREETTLYKELLKRIRHANEAYFCPECLSKGIKTPLYRHQVFCDRCGHKLDLKWEE